MNIRIAVRYAMLSCALLSLLWVGVWSQTCDVIEDSHITECIFCYYNSTEPAKPELLWATSNTAVLRARVCGCWCRNRVRWFATDILMNSTIGDKVQHRVLESCDGKEHCEVSGRPGSALFLYSAIYNYGINEWNFSSPTYVLFCSDKPPPRPQNVTCRKFGDHPQLRWIHRREEFDCHSYTQFVVRSGNEKKWYWLGEASPLLASGGAPFGGLVHRCPDNLDFLCANLNKTYNPREVQLGVRRVDADEYPRHLATSEPVVCSEYSGSGPLPSPPVAAAAPECPPPATMPSGEPMPGPPFATQRPPNNWGLIRKRLRWPSSPPPTPSPTAAECGPWSSVTLVALLVCAALVPIAFFLGRRSRGRKLLGVSWQQLREDRAAEPGPRSSVFVCGDRPPPYEYDDAAGVPSQVEYDYITQPEPLSSPPPPPLPLPLLLPLPPPPAARGDGPTPSGSQGTRGDAKGP